MIRITLPDGRWLELRPLLDPDDIQAVADGLEAVEDGLEAETVGRSLDGLTMLIEALEGACEKRSPGLDDLAKMTPDRLIYVVSEWLSRSSEAAVVDIEPQGLVH